MSILLTWIANSLAICIVAYFLKGVSVGSLRDAFLAGALLSLINATVRPVLVILTLPLTVVSLGLFYFVVTAFCLWLTAYFVPGFAVTDFLSTVVASILVSLFSTLIHRILANGPEVVRLDAAASHHRHVPRADPRGRDAAPRGAPQPDPRANWRLVVLGIAQDGGIPQLGCDDPVCQAIRAGQRKAERVASIACTFSSSLHGEPARGSIRAP